MIVKELKAKYPKEYRYAICDINFREINFLGKDMEDEEVDNLEVIDFKDNPEFNHLLIKTNIDIKHRKRRQ